MTGLPQQIEAAQPRKVNFHPDIHQQSELEQSKKTIRNLSRNLSSVVLSDEFGENEMHRQVRIDAERLGGAVQDAGQYAYGISAAEVWMLNDETGQLVRPGFRQPLRAAGWWSNPAVPRTDALSRLDDPTHINYDDPSPCPPGCDLAGILYANKHSSLPNSKPENSPVDIELEESQEETECKLQLNCTDETGDDSIEVTHDSPIILQTTSEKVRPSIQMRALSRMPTFHHRRTASTPITPTTNTSDDSEFASDVENVFENARNSSSNTCRPQIARSESNKLMRQFSQFNLTRNLLHHHSALFFRDISSLLQDPDTAKTSRLSLIQDAGFTHAAGIHFNCGGVEGIVIYYTIGSELNQPYWAGSVHGDRTLANEFYLFRATELIGSVVACIDARRAITVMTKRTSFSVLESASEDNMGSISYDTKPKITKAIKMWWSKCQGSKLQIPPSSSWKEAFFTFVGASTSLLLLAALYKLFTVDAGISIALGPLSSTIAAQYLLSSAPASQPRTIVLGFSVSGTVAMLFTLIPSWFLPAWTRAVVGTACSIFAMAKLGIYFPPAAAFAYGITLGVHDDSHWRYFAATVCTSVFLIFPAIFINNLNKNRQYPIYWGPFMFNLLRLFSNKKDNGY